MSEGGYKIRNKEGIHFVTFAVVGWIDVFTRKEYPIINVLVFTIPAVSPEKDRAVSCNCNTAYLSGMAVKVEVPERDGVYSITFTCQDWLPLFERTHSYETVYDWFNWLKKAGHFLTGYGIMLKDDAPDSDQTVTGKEEEMKADVV